MKEDLRIIKTKKAIKDAFIELVNEKGYAKVTVRDVSNKAQINRNTFYLHYNSKDELVDQLIHDVIHGQSNKFFSVLTRMSKDFQNVQEVVFATCTKSILTVINDEGDFYRMIIRDVELSSYINKLSFTLKSGLKKVVKPVTIEEQLRFEYFFNGFFGIVQSSLTTPNFDLETASKVIGKLVYNTFHCDY